MDGEFRWMPQRATYVLTITANKTDHHFEADPKFLHTDDLWMQLLKEVADFLAERGTDITRVKTKLKDYADIYMSKSYDEAQQEQDRAVGRTDDRSGIDGLTSRERAAGESVPAGASPDSVESHGAGSAAPVVWDNFPEAHGPSAADANAAGGGTAEAVQPD